jgi:hypothetical protein
MASQTQVGDEMKTKMLDRAALGRVAKQSFAGKLRSQAGAWERDK